MSLVYRLLYLVGFTPWDLGKVPPELAQLVEGDHALAQGRALGIGCGTGTQSVYLDSAETDSGPGPAGPLGKVPRRWYRLVRR